MSDDGKITVTLKAGTGFEAPWIVIHASDVKDAISQIDTGDFATLAERTVSAAEFFRGAHNVKKGLSTQPAETSNRQDGPSWSQQGSQQQTQQAPAAPAAGGQRCVHGEMTRKPLKVGTPDEYVGYFCPLPKGPTSCPPVWKKKGQ